MAKKSSFVVVLVVSLILFVGCNSSTNAVVESEETILSSEDYKYERAIINMFDRNFDVFVVEWHFVDNDMIYLLGEKRFGSNNGIIKVTQQEYLLDKANVIFVTSDIEKFNNASSDN